MLPVWQRRTAEAQRHARGAKRPVELAGWAGTWAASLPSLVSGRRWSAVRSETSPASPRSDLPMNRGARTQRLARPT